jgi:catechol 2,3-dioxygenase-like lactoylglutathione lyase family enzyme
VRGIALSESPPLRWREIDPQSLQSEEREEKPLKGASTGDSMNRPDHQPLPRLALVIVAVREIATAIRFYDAVFGWPRAVETPVYVEYALPAGVSLGIYERESFGVNTGIVPIGAASDQISPAELYLFSEEPEAVIERLTIAGARMLSPLRTRSWGDEAAYFADPDGHVLVIARAHDGRDLSAGTQE